MTSVLPARTIEHERRRLAALHEYRLLDAPADDELEAAVRVAALVAGVPTATLNLIDEQRQCQLTTVGFEGGDSARSDSMCAIRFQAGEFVHVRDASVDPTYGSNPWVTGVLADVRFYASAPLVTPQGYALGTLCVFDTEPRDLSDEQVDRLKDLAAMVVALFERRRQARLNAALAEEAERRELQLEAERQRLADERTFLQTLLDSLDTGVVACGSDGRLLLFNQAARQVHGAGEVPLARAYAGEVVLGEHLVVRNPEGQVRRFLANGRPIDTADGRRLGAVVAMHDITDTHRAEQRRRTRHAVAHALADATSALAAASAAVAAAAAELGWACAEYWQVDDDARHITRASSWTTPGRDLSGFTGAEPLSFAEGVGLAGAVWQEGGPVWSSPIPAGAAGGGRQEAAVEAGLCTAIGLPVRSGDRVVGVLAFFTDTEMPPDIDVLSLLDSIATHVSRYVERRRAEDLTLALAAARRDFDRVVEQVNDYLWTVEIRPDGTVHSVYASPNGTGVFGAELPTDADMGAALAVRIHPDDLGTFAAFHATVAAGEPADIEVRVRGDDGVTRWVWTRATARRDGDRLLVDGICTNVTDRRELAEQREQLLEEEQRHVRRLKELDRMKDEFVAVVVHELRNPIGVIAGYTELLREDADLADRRELSVIARTSSHLQTLVDDLLDLASLDAGHMTIDARPLVPAKLLRDATAAHQPAADAQRLTLTTGISCTRVLLGDARRLRQVVDNLLSNAIKYTPAGGTVTVTAVDSPGGITVTVTDSGIGIPAEQYPQLFTRFFRADTATSRGIKGTGLGLTIAKAIVEAHHGTITAGPAPGGGTSFTLDLPTD
ncbi:ATP-binding protein [Virgisporangium aurantiacum]|uniref:histidine kinase n=1 Tax=Virgisporangium aurantiacum TaxID=175570 RepID=A0A8J3Z868_9ACTN|nr:ATP-binding protein [Virgisporangium aurantiacum]GIJ56735.1 hypothetical protein Vau01_042510 [Virgisporangium aurantiacum]